MEISRCYRSPNFDERGTEISALVLHYTGMADFASAVSKLCDGIGDGIGDGIDNRVSAHYVIDESGCIFSLVAESKRAWHAGVSFWRGRESLNDCSLGIELVNKGHEFGYHAFPRAQMASLLWLASRIIAEHKISASWILAHSDIAIERKLDPGELFDWGYLAAGGVGFVPRAVDIAANNKVDESRGMSATSLDNLLNDLLTSIGYAPCCEGRVAAFQRRYRCRLIDNVADYECVFLARILARALLRGWGEL